MAGTYLPENARRYSVAPLAAAMGITLLVDGEEGGQVRGQPLEAQAELAGRLGVSMRTVRRWLGPADRWRHRPGLSAVQADRYAVAVGLLPWMVWSEWWGDAPGELDLFERDCRCRSGDRRPAGRECDRCGGRLRSSSSSRSAA